MIGTTLGPYRIVDKLGEGGMGAVWKARDSARRLTVALKVLPESLASSPYSRRRFLREVRAAAGLDHPGIVRIHDSGEIDGRPFIAMECVPGCDVGARLARGRFPVDKALRVAIAAGEALAHAHAHGVIHRDVSAHNIMVEPSGRVVVLDFGLALAAGASRFTSTSTVVGTTRYIAPEVWLKQEGDARADVYGLGVVLYEMLTGLPPFVAEQKEAVSFAAVNLAPQPPSLHRPRLPKELDRIVLRALAKEPELRYPGAAEMVADLRRVCAAMGAGGAAAVREGSGAGRGHRAAPQRARAPRRIRLAVMAFDDAGSGSSSDGGRQTVAGGLAEAVSVRLAQQARLEVIPPSEAGPALAHAADARWRAASLGANVVLRGAIERRGRDVTVRIEALDVRGGTRGAAAIAGRSGDFVALEDQLVEAIERLLGRTPARAPAGETARAAPDDVAAYEHFLEALGYLQRYEKEPAVDGAIGLLEGLRASTLPAARIHAALGRACLYKYKLTSQPDWEKRAVAECEQAIRLDPQLPEALITLGYVHSTTGRHAQAARALERALELQPQHPDALLGLAAAYEAAGAFDRAEDACRRAIALRPDYWGGHSRLGYLHFVQGRYARAIEHWRRVVRLTPDNARGFCNLGAASFQIGRYAAARAAYQRALQIQPSATAYSGLGTVYFYMGRHEEAAGMFERSTALKPDDAHKWANLGDAYRWIPGREADAAAAYDKAIALAREHLRLTPGDVRVMGCLANALARRGHHREAVREVERVLEASHGDVVHLTSAGILYHIVGDRERALECLRLAVRRGVSPRNLAREPELTGLRRDPEFRKILREGPPAGARSAPRHGPRRRTSHAR